MFISVDISKDIQKCLEKYTLLLLTHSRFRHDKIYEPFLYTMYVVQYLRIQNQDFNMKNV